MKLNFLSRRDRYLLIILAGIFLTLTTSLAGEKHVRDYCKDVQKVTPISQLQGIEQDLCRLRDRFSQNHAVVEQARGLIELVKKVEADPERNKSWEKDQELSQEMTRFSEALNQNAIQPELTDGSKLARELKVLNTKYGTVKQRQENLSEYKNDLLKALAMTTTGKAVLDCFEKTAGPGISGSQFVEITKFPELIGRATMAFNLVPDSQKAGQYLKTVFFSYDVNPVWALIIMAHEMKHGCNANQKLDYSNKMNELLAKQQAVLKDVPKEAVEKGEIQVHLKPEQYQEYLKLNDQILALNRQNDQNREIDEMRAYKVFVETFKELAKVAPGIACVSGRPDRLYGGNMVRTAGDYAAKMEAQLEEGTFPLFLASYYASKGFYEASYLFQMQPDGQSPVRDKDGNFVFRPELVSALTKEGFHVKQ